MRLIYITLLFVIFFDVNCSCNKKVIKVKNDNNKKKIKKVIKITKKKKKNRKANFNNAIYGEIEKNKTYFKEKMYYSYVNMPQKFFEIRKLVRDKKYDDALEYLRKLIKELGDSNQKSIAIYEMAEIFMKKKDYTEAGKLYKEIVDKFSGYPIAGNAEEALEYIKNKGFSKSKNKYSKKGKK